MFSMTRVSYSAIKHLIVSPDGKLNENISEWIEHTMAWNEWNHKENNKKNKSPLSKDTILQVGNECLKLYSNAYKVLEFKV